MRRIPPAFTPLPPTALVRALGRSGHDDVTAFAARLVRRWGGAPPVLVGSGTQALTLAITALAEGEGDVALPGWGCFDLATAAVGAGVGVRLYDLDPRTLQPDARSLARAAAGAAVGVVVSFFGIPVDPALLPDDDRIRWIHDAAQAHGLRLADHPIERRVDATVVSFGRGKGWTGLGGGALLPRSERARRLVERLPLADAPGGRGGMLLRGAGQWLLGRPSLYALPAHLPGLALGETRYHPPRPPHRLHPASATVLLATEAAADREADHRKGVARELRAASEGGAGVVTPVEVAPAADPGYLRFPVLAGGAADRERGVALGILPGYPRTLDTVKPLKPLLRSVDPLPGSAQLARELVTLPTHSRMSSRDRHRLRAWCTTPRPTPRPEKPPPS